jgi:hypothetical protein
MLTFNAILRLEGIDPEHVLLVRHTDSHGGSGLSSPYAAWRAHDGRFESFQQIQSRRVFDGGNLLASFVATPPPRNATLFVGLYNVRTVGIAPAGTRDPIYGNDVGGKHQSVIDSDGRLGDYVGRLTIDWGAAAIVWCQSARNQDKVVREIRDDHEPPFPGLLRFSSDADELPGLYPSWQEVLRNVKGVYLLVDKDDGKRYVGSAKGAESLYGRLLQYSNGGDGGDLALSARGRRRYQVTILQIVEPTTPDQRIEEIESVWKQKLLTREFGLNQN